MATEVQTWLVCDQDSIVVRDGMFKRQIGWGGSPDGPLPSPDTCVRVEVEVAVPGRAVARVATYAVNAGMEKLGEYPGGLSKRQKQLCKQHFDEEILPYMLKSGGKEVIDAFLAGAAQFATARPRKPTRPQMPTPRTVSFSCRDCGRSDQAGAGGITLSSVAGYWCPDCGVTICCDCQVKRLKELVISRGLPATIEDLGKSYPYEEWYECECLFCNSRYEMVWIHAKS